MREGWVVTITSINKKGKTNEFSFIEYGSLQDCVRLVLMFKPKRGYEEYKFEIERGRTLV